MNCPKCKTYNRRVRYHVGRYGPGNNSTKRCSQFDLGNKTYQEEPETDIEHLHIYCNTCQFDWRQEIIE